MDPGLRAALRFKRRHLLDAAERVEPLRELPGGLAVTTPSLPHVHELNLVVAPVACGAARITAACARLGLPKARLDGAGAAVELPPGWGLDRELVMVRRRLPDRPRGRHAVNAVGRDELAAAEDEALRAEPEGGDDEVRGQLIAQQERWESAAPSAQRLGIREGGRVVAWCRVYDDGAVSEIDGVMVRPAARGRGLGRALMEGVLERIPAGRATFLLADADDWPRHLYGRLGFDVVGERIAATRQLELRTAGGAGSRGDRA